MVLIKQVYVKFFKEIVKKSVVTNFLAVINEYCN